MDSWRAARVPALPGRGPEPRIHDTASGQVMPAAAGAAATIYACGITPYDATHIGHAATFVTWDLLIRAWLDARHSVRYVQNVTDVDDPLLERASRDGEDWRELAAREIVRYRSDMTALRVLPPDALVGAVEALPVIERFAGQLADRGALYELEGDQYFARSSDAAFGAMPRLGPGAMLELFAERGGDPGRPGKKDPLDPLVWLAARPGEPRWPSPFGPGRPGWHVECAAIATEHLGTRFDVQAGGSDLIFPHHEMSASHARVVYGGSGPDGPAFARRYLHAGLIRLDGEKMSKSLGNLVFVSALLAGGTDPMAVRLALLAGHYRQDRDWTAAGLAAAEGRLRQWRAAVARAGAVAGPPGAVTPPDAGGIPRAGRVPPAEEVPPAERVPPAARVLAAEWVLAAVRERIASDLDAPGALAAVDRWAARTLGAATLPPDAAAGAALVRDTLDALLGIAL